MNIRELLIKATFDPGMSEEKLQQSLRILQGCDMRKEKVCGYLSVMDAARYLGGISRVHLGTGCNGGSFFRYWEILHQKRRNWADVAS